MMQNSGRSNYKNIMTQAKNLQTAQALLNEKASGASSFGEMSPSDAKRYNQYWDDVSKGLDTNTRVKLN